MTPNTNSLTPKKNEKPIAEPPQHEDSEEEETDSEQDNGDGKLTAIPTHDKADEEDKKEDGEEETDSEDDDDKEEDENDGKLTAHSPSYEGEEEIDSEEDDADSEDDDGDGKLTVVPPHDNADKEDKKEDGEEETDSENDDDKAEDEKDGNLAAHSPSDKGAEQTAIFPISPSQALTQSVTIENNGSNSKLDSASSSDLDASKFIMQPIPKSLKIITEKRSHDEMSDGQQVPPKRNRKKPKRDGVEIKATSIPLIWGNYDEVILLRGLDDYKKKNGVVPKSESLADFYNSIKEKFQVTCTKEQVRNKIRHMKDRFFKNKDSVVNGSDPSFSKPHDRLVFEISKKVWGDAGSISNGSKSDNAKEEKIPMVYDETSNGQGENFWSKYFSLGCLFDELATDIPPLEFSKLRDRMSLTESEVAKEINDQCKQLMIKKMELKGKMLDSIKDVLKRDG